MFGDTATLADLTVVAKLDSTRKSEMLEEFHRFFEMIICRNYVPLLKRERETAGNKKNQAPSPLSSPLRDCVAISGIFKVNLPIASPSGQKGLQ